jgi:hypothetical protein
MSEHGRTSSRNLRPQSHSERAPQAPIELCSPTEALNILRPASKDVVAAADKLTQATHAGLNLYVNGQKVHVGFLPHVLVVGECQPDGEWTGRVTSTVKIGGIGPSDQCEFKIDQVKALLPQPQPELEKPWLTVSGSVNWTPPAMLASPPQQPEPRKIKRRPKRRRKPKPEPEKATPPEAKPPEPPPPQHQNPRLRIQEACRQFAAEKYPDGYTHIALRVIMHDAEVDKKFKRTVVPFPERDVWSRALGRRKG